MAESVHINNVAHLCSLVNAIGIMSISGGAPDCAISDEGSVKMPYIEKKVNNDDGKRGLG